MTQRFASVWFATSAAVFAAVAGCATAEGPNQGPNESLLTGDSVVSIPKDVDASAIAARNAVLQAHSASSSANEDFYLAIRRTTIEQPWFLSVYLKELAPFGPNPSTLGTKVIRFREQNGKLFVFDADNRRATSDVFSPDLIIDAYPIVESSRFNNLPGSGSYVLIDPSAGSNRFSALSDLFGTSPGPVRLETELSFVQKFKRADDGASFEQIITTYANEPVGGDGDVETNEFRVAATLGINLRTYRESPDFVPVESPEVAHFFLSDPFVIPNTGVVAATPVHWAFKRGMKPIKWLISPVLGQIAADPSLNGADLVAAAKRGIESWNDVFGFQVFTAEVDTHDTSFADDHVNYLIVDPDVSAGFAFADWRTNPNTGETRGASVYFGGGFFAPFDDDQQAAAKGLPKHKAKTKVRTLSWQGMTPHPLCVMWGPQFEKIGPPGNAQLTGKEKLERYIQHVVTHEIGHTLGLRHNFKGSLQPPTSSIMEYSVAEASIAAPTPGTYDRDAIKYLYGLSPALPTQPFATDEDTLTDPDAVLFDTPSPTPLYDYQIPQYESFSQALLAGDFPPELAPLIVQTFGTELLAYARAGNPEDAIAAWTAALSGARSPLANLGIAPASDALTAAIFDELYLHTTGAVAAPPSDPDVVAAIANDAKIAIINSDGAHGFATRRLVVDALKKAQNNDALLALLAAQTAVNASLPRLNPNDRALTQDLLARINKAVSPYFE